MMKNLFASAIVALLLFSCDSSDGNNSETPLTPELAKQMLDVQYGDEPEQVMDVYLPKDRITNITKTFLLVHGGGWKEGDKADLDFLVVYLKTKFPNYAIVNINYRLGSPENIGYPKQVEDISDAIVYINNNIKEYHIAKNYAMIGVSAGAHLSMLYSYRYNTGNYVKAVSSMVGPADFSDPAYEGNSLFTTALNCFVGDYPTYDSNPVLYNEVSPVNYVKLLSPKTIMFYGDSDALVPSSQGEILHNKLNQWFVYNELYKYEGMGHSDWTVAQLDDMETKMTAFFTLNF